MKFYKLGQGTQAQKSLDKGDYISFKPTSLRYSYDNAEAGATAYKWKPKTAEEKKTLSPNGYFRVGEREGERNERFSGIYKNALERAKQEVEEKKESVFKDELAKATERQNKRLFGLGRIFTTAKKRALIEQQAREKADEIVKDDSEEKAKKEAEKVFGAEYQEKQLEVPSTAIKNFKYNPKSGALKVKFQGGKKEYFYPRVPLEVIQSWLKAPSKGEFFMKNMHDQYSIFGKNHGKKSDSQSRGVVRYMKKYEKTNKNKWGA